MVIDEDTAQALAAAMRAHLVPMWLLSSNAHLNGARPIDVLRLGEHERVLEAVEAELAGIPA